MTASIVRTCVGKHAASKMRRITLKVQSLGGKIWSSDDAFKRAMRIRNAQAVMDHTLGNEHKQIIAFFTVFSKGTREMHNTCYPTIYRRYRLHDMELPITHYVDNPEEVQALLGREPAIIPSLSDGARFGSAMLLERQRRQAHAWPHM